MKIEIRWKESNEQSLQQIQPVASLKSVDIVSSFGSDMQQSKLPNY